MDGKAGAASSCRGLGASNARGRSVAWMRQVCAEGQGLAGLTSQKTA
ncbi:MAG: hypothetical protein AAF975_06545 [Spirochaetota bacterium]